MLHSTEMSWYIHAYRKNSAWLCHKVGTPKDPLESKKHLNHDTTKLVRKDVGDVVLNTIIAYQLVRICFLLLYWMKEYLIWTIIRIKSLEFNHLNWWWNGYQPISRITISVASTEINMTNFRETQVSLQCQYLIFERWNSRTYVIWYMICYALSWKSIAVHNYQPENI